MSPTHHDRHWGEHPAVRTGGDLTFGERAADAIASAMGSWRFIIGQTAFVIAWMTLAGLLYVWLRWSFDPFPYILLNLMFSTQAAYAAPILQMNANRKDAVAAEREEHRRKVQEETLCKVDAIMQHLGIEAKE